MAKTQEELNQIKTEYKTLNNKERGDKKAKTIIEWKISSNNKCERR